MTNGAASTTGKNGIFTGNGMDFRGGGRSCGTAHDGEFQTTTLSNTAQNDYQFAGQRQQNHPESSVEGRRREDDYGHDTVVVRDKKPRGGQDRSSTLGSAGGKMGITLEGTNQDDDGHQGHVADMAAITGGMLPVNTTSQGYALDNGEINMDDDMGEGTGGEGSEGALSGEGAHGALKANVDEGQGHTSTWSETKTKVCST